MTWNQGLILQKWFFIGNYSRLEFKNFCGCFESCNNFQPIKKTQSQSQRHLNWKYFYEIGTVSYKKKFSAEYLRWTEIIHSNWLQLIKWLTTYNNALFQNRVITLLKYFYKRFAPNLFYLIVGKYRNIKRYFLYLV